MQPNKPNPQTNHAPSLSLEELLTSAPTDPEFIRSKEAIDAYLEAERDSWETSTDEIQDPVSIPSGRNP